MNKSKNKNIHKETAKYKLVTRETIHTNVVFDVSTSLNSVSNCTGDGEHDTSSNGSLS